MASSSPIKNKNGVVYAYQIKVYRGRDSDGKQLKPYSTVWKIPDGMKNSRTIKKELDRFAVLFEQQCKEGLVSTDKKTFSAYAEYFMTLKERDQKHSIVCKSLIVSPGSASAMACCSSLSVDTSGMYS